MAMEDITQKQETELNENGSKPSGGESGWQAERYEEPDWYVENVLQRMERTGKDLSHYLTPVRKKPTDIHEFIRETRKTLNPEDGGTENSRSAEEGDGSGRPLWIQGIIESSKRIPQEELDRLPRDLSGNLDYYLYGLPKKFDEDGNFIEYEDRDVQ